MLVREREPRHGFVQFFADEWWNIYAVHIVLLIESGCENGTSIQLDRRYSVQLELYSFVAPSTDVTIGLK